ncbi:MAG TPA: hypothetical protein VIN59_09595 [Alphaproteobacteria bacterium]
MKQLLATAAILALLLASPARAEEPGMIDNVKVGFAQAIKDIQTWFGDDTPDTVEPAAGDPSITVTQDDEMLQVPPPVDPSLVEPAAGAYDDDTLQVPPPYMGPDSDATDPAAKPRASAFDSNQSNIAFGDQLSEDLNAITPAAGEGETPAIDCAAITGASARGEEVDASLLEQCKNPASVPVASDAATVTEAPIEDAKAPAQPAFEIEPIPSEPAVAPVTPNVTPEPLPETEPATGQ